MQKHLDSSSHHHSGWVFGGRGKRLNAVDPIRLITRAKNNRLLSEREKLGYTQKQFAIYIGLDVNTYCGIENLAKRPTSKQAEKIAIALDIPVETLFPEYLQKIRVHVSETTIPEADILSLADHNVLQLSSGDSGEEEELNRNLEESLSALTERQQDIVRRVYGWDGDPEPFSKIAADYGLTRSRIQQIYTRAMSKLRNPSQSKRLRRFVGR